MCLILFAHEVHPDFRLILAANRDEFHARPTASLMEWIDAPGVFGGRDLQAGGSWLAVSRSGRWAAVTNFRDAADISAPAARTRGQLVTDFVTGRDDPATHLEKLRPSASCYSGFNLLVGNHRDVCWTSNRADPVTAERLAPGIYGVSNHLLDTPWPKVERGKRALASVLESPAMPTPDDLLGMLLDRAYAADHELPSTGISTELERALSAAFISTPEYGTRSSTALLIGRDGRVLIAERRYGPDGLSTGETLLHP